MESNNNYKYGIKSTFSQCLALVGAGFLQVGVGTQLICSTVIIGALSDNSNENEWLTMTIEQMSWFGSLLYLCTPLGSIISSLVLNRLGHKNCMIITNIPFLVSQIMFFYAENVETMYACSIIMGLGVGFSGGPFSAYIGEVCEPKLRGALMSATNVFFFGGSLLFTTIYAITRQWRLTVLANMAIPIITIVILCMSPDSPLWLLSKGKNEKAQRTLGKLRGWVTHDKCSNEFHEMVVFMSANKNSTNDKNGSKNDSECSWKQLFKPDVLKPFRLLLIYFFFSNLLSGVPFGPYLVVVLLTFGADVDVQWTVAFSLGIAIVGGILTVFLVNRLGKRFLTLTTLSICSICYISIGLIGVYWTDTNQIKSWLLLISFFISTFVASFGIMPIGWILLTEIFPMKSRNITCSICSTLSFVLTFFMTKYYPNVVDLVDFYNTFTIFGFGGLIGCVYFYFCLPETENKTLQEISECFK
ncbi:facilitated trehalose transporter Tret1-like isoform X2 [Rhopalosiphum padi]|nr:facilitated trehalose transporter Tret1-like isoform X2 [Rhopalosiphum padi]XP_060837390.1 facilitated trehalose transporter Tret1-like isoform X2 [Rhopalosiphum padi]XP_060837391.1 facilitated trehalose transporter Tret1-like isoform X2 [Rhopalosiphum padi]XP_060837392.1 facilitated trehalose transporter Tret1-like isoform X2 [Rhopalosiphum padi]XP_060837393.1 facilitated trehalose transporter Tret1-like isoform X2 [Rhopalosiphum padi]